MEVGYYWLRAVWYDALKNKYEYYWWGYYDGDNWPDIGICGSSKITRVHVSLMQGNKRLHVLDLNQYVQRYAWLPLSPCGLALPQRYEFMKKDKRLPFDGFLNFYLVLRDSIR